MGNEWTTLERRAQDAATADKTRKRRNYELARRLGFKPYEAQVMAGWAQERILAMAKQRSGDNTEEAG